MSTQSNDRRKRTRWQKFVSVFHWVTCEFFNTHEPVENIEEGVAIELQRETLRSMRASGRIQCMACLIALTVAIITLVFFLLGRNK